MNVKSLYDNVSLGNVPKETLKNKKNSQNLFTIRQNMDIINTFWKNMLGQDFISVSFNNIDIVKTKTRKNKEVFL